MDSLGGWPWLSAPPPWGQRHRHGCGRVRPAGAQGPGCDGSNHPPPAQGASQRRGRPGSHEADSLAAPPPGHGRTLWRRPEATRDAAEIPRTSKCLFFPRLPTVPGTQPRSPDFAVMTGGCQVNPGAAGESGPPPPAP